MKQQYSLFRLGRQYLWAVMTNFELPILIWWSIGHKYWLIAFHFRCRFLKLVYESVVWFSGSPVPFLRCDWLCRLIICSVVAKLGYICSSIYPCEWCITVLLFLSERKLGGLSNTLHMSVWIPCILKICIIIYFIILRSSCFYNCSPYSTVCKYV